MIEGHPGWGRDHLRQPGCLCQPLTRRFEAYPGSPQPGGRVRGYPPRSGCIMVDGVIEASRRARLPTARPRCFRVCWRSWTKWSELFHSMRSNLTRSGRVSPPLPESIALCPEAAGTCVSGDGPQISTTAGSLSHEFNLGCRGYRLALPYPAMLFGSQTYPGMSRLVVDALVQFEPLCILEAPKATATRPGRNSGSQ